VTKILKVNGIQKDTCNKAGCSQFQTWALGLLLSGSYRKSQAWQPWIVGSLNHFLSILEPGHCSMYQGSCQSIGVQGIIVESTFMLMQQESGKGAKKDLSRTINLCN